MTLIDVVGFTIVLALTSPLLIGLIYYGLIKGGPPKTKDEALELAIDPISYMKKEIKQGNLSEKKLQEYENFIFEYEAEKARQKQEMKEWNDFLRSTENGQNSDYSKK